MVFNAIVMAQSQTEDWPSITVQMSDGSERQAVYESGSGTPVLIFRIPQGDAQASVETARTTMLARAARTLLEWIVPTAHASAEPVPVAVLANSLQLNGARIRSTTSGKDAVLAHEGGGRPAPSATFADLPEFHDSMNAFTVELNLSEAMFIRYRELRDANLTATNAQITKVKRTVRKSNLAWAVTITPRWASQRDITLTLTPPAQCPANERTTLCTTDGRTLDGAVQAQVPANGAARAALAAADTEVHEGPQATLEFEVRLSATATSDVRFDYATRNGTATAATRTRRGDYVATGGTATITAGGAGRNHFGRSHRRHPR